MPVTPSILKRLLPVSSRIWLRFTFYRLRSPWYAGTKVGCPCCGGRFSAFLSFQGKPNCRCPRCISLERTRLLWLYLERELQIPEQKWALLHFAPEPSLQDRLKKLRGLSYLSTDLDSPLAMAHFDIMDIPLGANSQDLILNTHVLAHVPDDRVALRELYRILKPGGLLLVQASVAPDRKTIEDRAANATQAGRLQAYGQDDLFRKYGQDFAGRLKAAGFAVEIVPYARHLTEEERRYFGILEDEPIYVCRK